ncbi:TetR/AcrR family transcriptional regulator [Streptomyces parvulus]|uniref:TetR/AcrR family transcriptional regulator n=1 Tax=Streptomyces parvulus TaxID=146923 RepID=UPI0037CFC311
MALELAALGKPLGVNAIARQLGVRPSSLYNHVDGLDGIVELVRGRLTERYLVRSQSAEWDSAIETMLRALRQMYADYPTLVPLLVSATVRSETVIAEYDRLVTTLLDAGFREDEVLGLVAVIDAFAIGFGLDLAAPANVWDASVPTANFGRLLGATPTGRERSDLGFEIGLGMLMSGLRQRLAHHTADVSPAPHQECPPRS